MDAFKSILIGMQEVAEMRGNKEVADSIQAKLDNWDEYKKEVNSGKLESFDYNDDANISNSELIGTDYLYLAAYAPYLEQIKKDGKIIPGKNSDWGISDKNSIYLSRDLDDAASFAEHTMNTPYEYLNEIIVLEIDIDKLDFNRLSIYCNQNYSFDIDVDVEYIYTWVQFEYHGEIPLKAVTHVIDYDSGRSYPINESTSLTEMAVLLSKAKETLIRNARPYFIHLFKCVIFGNTTNNLLHWEKELSSYLSIVNDITIKGSNKKPSIEMYEDYFFYYFGDERHDYIGNLEDFKLHEGRSYPDFDITSKLVDNVFDVVQDFALYFASIFSKKNDLAKDEIMYKVIEYFNDAEAHNEFDKITE